ncbi:MAG TPA: 50S ribosomal protein L9 [Nitrospirae bacterium]|nr:50S ribosomal protein L9 [Nitrospirota bacterium]
MKVILKEDIEGLGYMGDIVNVKDGYGRNYLIPKGLAVYANEKNVRELEHHKRIIAQKVRKIKFAAQTLAEKLSSKPVQIRMKAGEEDKLYGSVTNIDIEKALKEMGFDIDRRKIILEEPIKRLGEYTAKVKLHPEVVADLKIEVVKEE